MPAVTKKSPVAFVWQNTDDARVTPVYRMGRRDPISFVRGGAPERAPSHSGFGTEPIRFFRGKTCATRARPSPVLFLL